MANTLLTIDMITREALMILKNNLTFTRGVNRTFDGKFGVDGAQIGDALRIRKPPRYTVRSGAAISTQDVTEDYTTLPLDSQKGVDTTFTTKELTLSIDEFSKRILGPAIAQLANQIDYDGLSLYKNVFNSVGTPATVPNAMLTYGSAGGKLSDSGAPVDGNRKLVIGSTMEYTIVDAVKGLFQSSTQIKKQYEDGNMGRSAGFDWSMSQNIATHTVGPLGGTPLVNGASQTGASLVTDGWTAAAASRLVQGDVFTIAGVFAVNPMTRASTGSLQQFVVTAAVSSDGSGNATIPISPSIVTSGATQTVSGSPADNAALTIVGAAAASSPQGLAFHRDAFALGMADLEVPRGVHFAGRMNDPDLGLSIRIVRQYDIATDKIPCRIDALYGWKCIRPELACRVQS